jgi:hypothetical protein
MKIIPHDNKYLAIAKLAMELAKAESDSQRACEALGKLEIGESRARRTSLNAKWSRSAEQRDRLFHNLHVAIVRAGIAERFDDDYYGEHQTGHKWCPVHIVRERP